MGKHRFIDHRRPPKEAGQPKILRGGVKVDPHPIPDPPDVQARRKAEQAKQRELDEAQRLFRVKEAEAKMFRQQAIDARDALAALQVKQQEQAVQDEPTAPTRIEIVQIDDVHKDDATATLDVLLEADGVVGEATVVLPVDQLKAIIKQKRTQPHAERNQAERKPNPTRTIGQMPELRDAAQNRDLQDEPAVETEAGGAELSELRTPRAEEPT